MLTIKAPLVYINQTGILAQAGQHIAPYGKRAVVVGSETALGVAGGTLLQSLSDSGIAFTVHTFEGYPSETNFARIQAVAQAFQADSIIGLGGGRVLDTVKVVGDRETLAVITIPTIAATCAAWAAVSIVYDDEGTVTGAALNTNSPPLILADPQIIASAPARYLKAGIVDTLAKFYETLPNLAIEGDSLLLKQTVNTAQLAYRDLTEHLDEILTDLKEQALTTPVVNAIDAVIYLAGLVGSITSGFFGGFAHSFYNVVTGVPGTRDRLHGERVAFGLLIQFVLQEKSTEELARELDIFRRLDQPVTLAGIGISPDDGEVIDRISEELTNYLPSILFLPGIGAGEIKAAIYRADELGRTLETGED